MALDRNHRMPLYLQLKRTLAAAIADGTFGPGTRFPSERDIQEQYGISRNTVREALQELLSEGVIETVPGRGTFVARSESAVAVSISLGGFTADVRRQHLMPGSVLLDARLMPDPPPELLDALCLPAGAEVVKLERLRLVNNRPLALHTVYLPHALCPQLLQHNLAQESLFDLLRTYYGLALSRATEQVYAALADARETELLQLGTPASVLRAERTTFLADGRVIEFAQASYCGEWYRLNLTLDAIRPALPKAGPAALGEP